MPPLLFDKLSAAILGSNAMVNGWFDLDLQGTQAQIHSALHYLNDFGLEMWDESKTGIW